MDEELLCGLENFEDVWRRVRGEAPPAVPARTVPMPQTHTLCALMDEKCAQSRLYTALARCCGASRNDLERLAREERRQFRALQLEYFLITGACHRAGAGCAHFTDVKNGLRMAWLQERELAVRMEGEAASAGATLRETLQRLAKEDEAHARTLYAVLQRCFCSG